MRKIFDRMSTSELQSLFEFLWNKWTFGIGFFLFGVILAYVDNYIDCMSLFYFYPIVYFIIVIPIAKAKTEHEHRDELVREERERMEAEEYKKENPQWEAEEFYELCKEQGITEASSASEIARVLLFAKNNEIAGSREEILERFKIGKAIVDKKDRIQQAQAAAAQKAARVAELRGKEGVIHRENSRYLSCYGQEKQRQMCLAEANYWRQKEREYEKKYDDAMKGAADLYHGSAEREGSWALRGGLASGLAGGAAGLATALDTQRENAEIRERNKELRNNINSAVSFATYNDIERKVSARQEAEQWEIRAEEAKNKLVENLQSEKLMKILNPQVKNMSISESGAVLLDVTYNRTSDSTLMIYENVPAAVDGFLYAVLWVNNQRAGEAIIALPWDGSDSFFTLHGVCTNPTIKSTKYDVTFEPHKMWAIERKLPKKGATAVKATVQTKANSSRKVEGFSSGVMDIPKRKHN